MLKALRQSESLFSRYYLNEEFNDVMFTFELRDDIIIGQPFRYQSRLVNRQKKEIKFALSLNLSIRRNLSQFFFFFFPSTAWYY